MPVTAVNNHKNAMSGSGSAALSVRNAVASDSDEQPVVFRRLYVGTGGNVVLVDVAGNESVHMNVPGGSYLGDGFWKQIRANKTGGGASTTAADLIIYE